MKWSVILVLLLLMSCKSTSKDNLQIEENRDAKSMLQGVWVDDDSEEPILRITGDTIYYADESIAPVYFKIIEDTLMTYGTIPNGYIIEKQDKHAFWFHAVSGEKICLHKVEGIAESTNFIHKIDVPTYHNVVKKDSVVFYDNHRYHGYVYINPSEIKIVKPGLTSEGMIVDNVYYDNIIHICVYEGRISLFAKDIKKQMFTGIIPQDFLQYAILSDMDFGWVDAKGYHFQANVCVPDEATCYLVNLTVSREGIIDYKLIQ